MKKSSKKIRVVDFFCGAGGFSEGFRQQGFQIVKGIDFWQAAIDTHNLNHGLNDVVQNVLDFWGEHSGDIDAIERLEDTEFLIGSPSCVSFSMSNRAGKADKASGIHLIEAYLRVIAVKKNKKNSILKAWYMENVPRSRDFVRKGYTFKQLNLSAWAKQHGLKQNDVALRVRGAMLNAGDYGAPQERRRFIAGEWIATGEFVAPHKTHPIHKTVAEIREKMPRVNQSNIRKRLIDPNYSNIKLNTIQLTDHFYDTGVYKIDWENAKFLKTNHPFMGKMSFPENEERTSRTIMATRAASTRESLLYKSEYNREGDGEYRLPTIRELASLMGFPYVYQFTGSESVKWRQVGNSVCAHQSAALAKALRTKMGLKTVPDDKVDFSNLKNNFNKVENLNIFAEKIFNTPRKRQARARFRRHALKVGNMTVDLMNYHPDKKDDVASSWYVAAFFGTGDGYERKVFVDEERRDLEGVLRTSFRHFDEYKKRVGMLSCQSSNLQTTYEDDLHLKQKENPIFLLKELSKIISSYECYRSLIKTECIAHKKQVPLAQLMSAYGLLTVLRR